MGLGIRAGFVSVSGPYPPPAQRARFRREFDLTCRLRGRGVVQVESWEELDGLPTIVLRDTGATSLEKLWREGPPPLHIALDVGVRIVEAVHANLRGGAYTSGPLSSVHEAAVARFHDVVEEAVRAGT